MTMINKLTWKFPSDYYQNSRNVLDTAIQGLSAYKSWRFHDPGIDCDIDTRYRAMPVLTKRDIREHFPDGFVPSHLDVQIGLENGEISFVDTSSTTGDKVTNIWNQTWWDASERASWKLNSNTSRIATGDHKEAILVNPLNVGYISDIKELPIKKRRLSRFLYLNEKTNELLWTPKHMNRIIHELEIFKPAILEANPSLLSKLSRYIFESKKAVYQPELIILTYENPLNLQLKQIRKIFTSPISSSYGTTETGYVFMQCEDMKFHQNSEYCRVDFQPFKKEHGGPFLGRILVTPFKNKWYYLVRFDVGDIVRIDKNQKCACGRDSGLILSEIEGRFYNATLTCSGRLVTSRELDDVTSAIEEIDYYQLIQVSSDIYELHVVSPIKDKQKLSEKISSGLKTLYGKEAKISVIYENAIPSENSGKFVVSKTLFPLNIENYIEKAI